MTRLLAALCVLLAGPAYGASFYISTTGSDTNGCTNQTTDACASFPRCGAVMSAGDTCYALDGTYVTTGTDGWTFAIAGGTSVAKKKFTSLSQDATKVIIRATNPTTENTYKLQGNIGGSQSDYLEFSYLTLEGRMSSNSPVDGLTYHHNIFRCPNVGTGGGNSPFIYLSGDNTEMIDDVWVYENLFTMDDSCPPNGTASIEWIVWFNVNGAIIEKNDFVNTHSTRGLFSGVYLKRANKDVVIRQNYFRGNAYDTNGSIWSMDCDGASAVNQFGDRSAYGGSSRCNNKIYQNVFDAALSGGIYLHSYAQEQEWVYNNTVVNAAGRCLGVDINPAATGSGTGHVFFNNICYKTNGNYADAHIAVPEYGADSAPCMADQGYIDNNLYYSEAPATAPYADCSEQNFTTLAAWKTHNLAASKEQNSTTEDPLFVSAGSRNYRLQAGSPARSGGRGGSYSSYRGAYITSDQSDQVGCSWSPSCFAYGTSSAQYGNVRRVDLKGVSVK